MPRFDQPDLDRPWGDANDSPDLRQYRRQLILRGAGALLLIATLLGGLAWFERMQSRTVARSESIASNQPGNAGSQKLATTPPSPVSEEKSISSVAQNEAPKLTQDETHGVPVEQSAATQDASQELAKATDIPANTAAGKHGIQDSAATHATDASRPEAEVAAPPEQIASLEPAPVIKGKAYVIQVGIFAKRDNAEEVQAKLSQAGIPTRVETHVQLGPFKTRQEALAAQERLQSLGLGEGIVVAVKR